MSIKSFENTIAKAMYKEAVLGNRLDKVAKEYSIHSNQYSSAVKPYDYARGVVSGLQKAYIDIFTDGDMEVWQVMGLFVAKVYKKYPDSKDVKKYYDYVEETQL